MRHRTERFPRLTRDLQSRPAMNVSVQTGGIVRWLQIQHYLRKAGVGVGDRARFPSPKSYSGVVAFISRRKSSGSTFSLIRTFMAALRANTVGIKYKSNGSCSSVVGTSGRIRKWLAAKEAGWCWPTLRTISGCSEVCSLREFDAPTSCHFPRSAGCRRPGTAAWRGSCLRHPASPRAVLRSSVTHTSSVVCQTFFLKTFSYRRGLKSIS
ncbi:hypothetical protein BDZ88DRAFT_11077 [Geranomyces variabilis]|nr:hypothetical protein BDZ88DRAFT_11077 [Geranomyces variabilis]